MRTFTKLSPAILVTVILLLSGCASTKKSKTAIPNYIGQWNYTLSLPDGDFPGYLKFSEQEGQTTGMIGNNEGETQLQNFLIDEEKMSGNFDFQGYSVSVTGTFAGEILNGMMSAAGYDFPFEAKKQQE